MNLKNACTSPCQNTFEITSANSTNAIGICSCRIAKRTTSSKAGHFDFCGETFDCGTCEFNFTCWKLFSGVTQSLNCQFHGLGDTWPPSVYFLQGDSIAESGRPGDNFTIQGRLEVILVFAFDAPRKSLLVPSIKPATIKRYCL